MVKATNLTLLINLQNFFRVSMWTTSFNSQQDSYWRQSLITQESLLFRDSKRNQIIYIVDSTSSEEINVNVETGNSKLKQAKSTQINLPSM